MMRILHYIQVLALLGAVSCGSSEPSIDQSTADSTTTESTPETAVSDAEGKQATGDTRPEVRYYLLSEK